MNRFAPARASAVFALAASPAVLQRGGNVLNNMVLAAAYVVMASG